MCALHALPPEPAPIYRTPPHNIEAEQALLGALLVNTAAIIDRTRQTLQPDDFYHPAHQAIYRAILSLTDRQEPANATTIAPMLAGLPSLADYDGGARRYLGGLMASVVTIINAGEYARTIADCAQRRRLIDAANLIAESAYDQSIDAPSERLIADAEEQIFSIRRVAQSAARAVTLYDAAMGALDGIQAAFKGEGVIGVKTGLQALDDQIGAIKPGDLTIIAARPSMGKTGLAATIAKHVADSGIAVGFSSMEMTAEQIAMTRLAETGISTGRQRGGDVDFVDIENLLKTAASYRDLKFFIDPSPALTIGELTRRARLWKAQHDIGLLVVDYLQLMQGSSSGRDENRNMAISAISGGLKAIAKDLSIPVIALSQLSRGVEAREDKRPMLSDLRDSGAIEQDADTVIFVYREEYYLAKSKPVERPNEDREKHAARIFEWHKAMDACRGKAELIIAKQRFGQIDAKAMVAFDGVRQRFEDLLA